VAVSFTDVYRRARTINQKTEADATTVLTSVQKISLKLTKDERLLASIPRSDRWRQPEITDHLSRKNSWPLAAGLSVACAFLFTLADSFVSLDRTVYNAFQGHAVGAIWLWLLCLQLSAGCGF